MPKLLLVDDDPHVSRTLLDILALHGYPAVRAESGERALERLEREPFDLVILDVRMPGMNGFQTCMRIRERYGPSLPVLILTALGDTASLKEGYEAGADDFLTKPVDMPALVLKVRAFLRIKSLHDQMLAAREEAQARARDLAQLHEIGRDWSLIAEPEEFNRMVTQRLATLIGAPVCLIAVYDPASRTMSVALPAHGMPDEVARGVRYQVKPEYRNMWSFRTGRPYLSNHARSDPRLLQDIVRIADMESVVLVPMLSEGAVLGLLVAANKPGGFTDADVQLLSMFAGPAASFIRSRQIFSRQRRHAARLERLAGLVAEMSSAHSRSMLLQMATSRARRDLGYDRVAFFSAAGDGGLKVERESGAVPGRAYDRDLVGWASRGARPLQSATADWAELAVPVRAGERELGVLDVLRSPGVAFDEEEVNLLSTLAGQLAVTLQKNESAGETARLAAQMATLYDLGLETSALRDLRALFEKATEEAGRLIKCDHASVLRLDPDKEELLMFAAWALDPQREPYHATPFHVGQGVAGSVAQTRMAVLVNDPAEHPSFVERGNKVARLLCVPLSYYDQEQKHPELFGVLNATRGPGAPAFTHDDLEYLTRFASQLSIAVANSMAFDAERRRSEQLELVNTLLREIAGSLSRERILDTAVRRIQEAFHFPVVCIGIPDPGGQSSRIVAVASNDLGAKSRFPQPLSGGVTGRAIQEKRTVLVPDVGRDPDYVPLFPSIRSMVAIPILAGEDVVAVLAVASDQRRAFDRGQVITLETLADGVGIIMRNAQLYQALERTNARLVELDRMKSELVNIVAHDFRAPLAGVLGHAELLEWKPDDPRERRVEQARAIIQSATHMANLVDKTLKTTRLETGHFPFEFSLVDLAATLRAVVARFPRAGSHPLRLQVPDEPVPVWADRDRMAEVLDNLVSNAIKYSPEGGEVDVALERLDETATVSVGDRGIGIEAADMDRLFRPFSRVRNRRTASIEGSGLGLYICDRIVRAHAGRMAVESRPGAGSTFSFHVPLYGAAAQMRAPLILVAAGDEWTRREVRRVAEEQGFGTHEVSDGVDAVEAVLRLMPAAVVIDRVLPRLGAAEVAERLKENPATEAIPLFALAGAEDLGERAALFRAFVPKPLDPKALSAVLADLSRERRVVVTDAAASG
jgi:signal transduction histidine kinase/DNA-binding response OmpR family regulator